VTSPQAASNSSHQRDHASIDAEHRMVCMSRARLSLTREPRDRPAVAPEFLNKSE
jgi:hypothetical protein